jgi:tetratricopeptide (TPR) repeat protein
MRRREHSRSVSGTAPKRGPRSRHGRWRALLFAALAITIVAPQADAARKKDKKSTSKHVLDAKSAKKLGEAHELLQEEKFAEARAVLDSFNLEKVKPYTFTLVHQAYGYIDANNEDYSGAADHFAAALTTNTLPESQQLSTRFNLGQIYMMLDRWDDAVETLEAWFDDVEKPSPVAYYMLAQAYYQSGDHPRALEPARMAVKIAKDPRETWMGLLLSLYMEEKRYEDALPLLMRMTLRYEKAVYWTQLAAVLMELERDEDSMAVQQLAHAKGLLTRDQSLTRLAQMYVFHGLPWWGARVMKESIESGAIEADVEAWRLLANSLLAARETQEALGPLEKAASLAEDGQVYIQLAQVYIQNERWTDALDALDRAFAKGGLQNAGHAHLLVGIAAYQVKRLGKARSAFARAAGHEKTRDMAERWLEFVAREEAAQAG